MNKLNKIQTVINFFRQSVATDQIVELIKSSSIEMISGDEFPLLEKEDGVQSMELRGSYEIHYYNRQHFGKIISMTINFDAVIQVGMELDQMLDEYRRAYLNYEPYARIKDISPLKVVINNDVHWTMNSTPSINKQIEELILNEL